MSELRASEEYVSFRSSVPLKKIIVDDDTSKFWGLYDAGPRNIRCPLICFPPASGHADVFYKQVLGLSANGYRVISVEYPVYWEMNEFLDGFLKLLDDLHLDRVHLFGASLGGYLAQKFAEYTQPSHRVQSLILCNSFVDTTVFQQTNSASSFWLMPALLLKKMVMGSFEKGPADSDVIKSIDFMVDSLDSLEQSELASRLTLNCTNSYVEPQKLADIPITIIDVNDGNAISNSVREETYKCYPQAKLALMKTGGNFPYLSRAEEINVHLKIHLMQFWGTRFSALDPSRELHADSNGTDDEERENDFTKQTSR